MFSSLKFKFFNLLHKLKKTKPVFAFLILLFISLGIAVTVFLVQRKTQLKSRASTTQPTHVIQNTPYNLELAGLLPNKEVTINVWKMNDNPRSNNKIGLAGVYLHWENYPSIVNLFNRNYGDKTIGTADDVTSQMLNRKHLSMMKAAGVKTIAYEIEWGRVENQQDRWSWTLYDKVFDEIKRFSDNENYYFEPVVMLSFSPPWITSAPTGIPNRGFYPPKDLWINSTLPANPDDNLNTAGSARYNKFAEEVVKRYRPGGTKAPGSSFGIKHWVIWNETNWEFFRDPTDAAGQRYMPTMKTYAYFFKGAADSIHTVDPSLKVLTAGFADGDYSWAQKFSDGSIRSLQNTVRKFYEEMRNAFGNTAKNSFDILNVHTYLPSSTLPAKFSEIASIKSQFGDSSKKIWLTEWGCDSQECLTNNLSQTLSKWQEGKRVFDGITDIEKHLWFSSKGFFLNDQDAQTATTLQSIAGRSADQWWMFAGMLYTSFKPKPVFSQLAKDTGSLETEQTYNPNQTPDSGGNFQTAIPGSYFSQTGKYLVFFAQDERINTESPIYVDVIEGTSPVNSPTPHPTSTPPIQNGNYFIKIRVKGDSNGGKQPNIRLYVNHPITSYQQIASPLIEWITSGAFEELTYDLNLDTALNQIDLVTTNSTSDPNSLTLESVMINDSTVYPGLSTCVFDGGSEYRAFDGVSIIDPCPVPAWNNGSFRLTNLFGVSPTNTPIPTVTTQPSPAVSQQITVNARGRVVNTSTYPELKLYINYEPGTSATPVATWITDSINRDFTYILQIPVYRIDVVFDNQVYSESPYQNTFPFLNSIKIGDNVIYSVRENQTYPNQERCNYDRGSGNRAFDNTVVVQCQNPMYWPGALKLTNF